MLGFYCALKTPQINYVMNINCNQMKKKPFGESQKNITPHVVRRHDVFGDKT